MALRLHEYRKRCDRQGRMLNANFMGCLFKIMNPEEKFKSGSPASGERSEEREDKILGMIC